MKGKVSRDKSNFCVVCGAEIPEGFQICLDCARANYYKENWEKKNPKKKRSHAHEAKYERWN